MHEMAVRQNDSSQRPLCLDFNRRGSCGSTPASSTLARGISHESVQASRRCRRPQVEATASLTQELVCVAQAQPV